MLPKMDELSDLNPFTRPAFEQCMFEQLLLLSTKFFSERKLYYPGDGRFFFPSLISFLFLPYNTHQHGPLCELIHAESYKKQM